MTLLIARCQLEPPDREPGTSDIDPGVQQRACPRHVRGHGEGDRGEAKPGSIAVSARHQASVLVQRGSKEASNRHIFRIFS